MGKMICTDRVRTEEVLQRVEEWEEYATNNTKKEGELDWSRVAYELPSKTR